MSQTRISIAIALFLAASTVQACSCVEIWDARAGLKNAALVFTGEVVSATKVMLPRTYFTKKSDGQFVASQIDESYGLYTFRVISRWKGEPAKEYTILAGQPPDETIMPGRALADCALHFDKGTTYLIFATEGFTEATMCAPNGPVKDRKDDIAILDKLEPTAHRKSDP